MEKEISTIAKVRFADCDPIGHLNNVKYLEYMLNAREDHVEEFYGFTYEKYLQLHGCTWIAIENQIAYLKEVKANTSVKISSKTIRIDPRTITVEILMKSLDEKTIYSVLWVTAIYFNMKTRKSESQPEEIKQVFHQFLVDLPQKDFASRSSFLRKQNKLG